MDKAWGAAGAPPDSVIQTVSDLYDRGRTVDALERALEFAPLENWTETRACSLASRIALGAGANRLPAKLAARMWRADPGHPLSQFDYGMQLVSRRGPLEFWLRTRSWPVLTDATPEWKAEFWALKARVVLELRDFNLAEKLLEEAEALAPKKPWIRLQRAALLEKLERVDEALEIASDACELHPHPFYRSGVQTVAPLLQALDRDEEAIALLRQADAAIQSGPLAAQLYSLLADSRQWPEAEQALERYAALSPLLEPAAKPWLQSQRARIAYHLGKRASALETAKNLPDVFHRRFAEKLAAPAATPEQTRLDVPFVRQHFKTCAPATLAALAQYWRMPAEHLHLVEAMCYDGTTACVQRDWAERHGWLTREFRVTWESALALLSRGVPFAISTVEATSAHMQAVIGFDRARSSLLLRDPGQPYGVEVFQEIFLERYRPFGPCGMIFLPLAEADRLRDILLPDAELYDERQALALALTRHDRAQAQAALDRLESAWPDHELTWEGRHDLAAYDANAGAQLGCLDHLLEVFPGNPARLLRRLACLHASTPEERIEFLEKECARKSADAALFVELAKTLLADAPRQQSARRWMRRAMRARPVDSGVILVHAELHWRQGDFDLATELYRFAATLEGYREPLYQSWFISCRQVRQTEAALAHLRDRFRLFGGRSSQPALTLAWALAETEQPGLARQVLTEALQTRPDDGLLILRAATVHGRLGEREQSTALLNSAKGKVRENDWLRAAAGLAENRFDHAASLRLSRQLLALEPLAVDAHERAARARAQLEGCDAALSHLKEAAARHPHHGGLQRLLMERLRASGAEAAAGVAREFLRLSPSDAWTRRELAAALANLKQPEEALTEAAEALRLEPRNPVNEALLGSIQERFGHFPAARDHFREAVRLSVDNTDAISGLLRLAASDQERKEELAFIERELVRQVVRGDGLLAYIQWARPVLEPEALLAILREARAKRPDLWHAWSALVMQLDHLGKREEALDLARQAAERFPHLARTWLDLSAVHQHRREPEEEITAASRAFEINPSWNQAAFALAGALARHRSLDEARIVYERTLLHTPNDPQLHSQLASVQWRLRQPQAALASVENALRLASNAGWAWNLLAGWSKECGEPQRPAHFARELTRERPGEAHAWLMLAKALMDGKDFDERLGAVDSALALDPRLMDAWDLKAGLLTGALRFDAATEACDQGIATGPANSYCLLGRRAWIEAQRDRRPEAIRQMRAVLAKHAGYAWGWSQLTVWLTEQEAFAEAEQAATQLLKLQPHDTGARRQLAILRLNQGDKTGAIAAFGEVLDSSPTDRFAAEQLFDLQLEEEDWTGAAVTLRRMQTHQPGARTLAREIILDVRESRAEAALDLFKTLCEQPSEDSWPLQASMNAFEYAGLARPWLKVLKGVLRQDICNRQAGATAIQLLLKRNRRIGAARLLGQIKPPEAKAIAAAVLAQSLANRNSRRLFQFVFWRHRAVFLENDEAWAQAGYALVKFKHMRAAANWLADWRSRQNVQPWVLFNLCLALRQLGDYPQAYEIAAAAVKKRGARPAGGPDVRLFLAVEDALTGSIESATRHLRSIHAREKVRYDIQILALARALVEFQQSPIETRREKFKTVRSGLDNAFPKFTTLRSSRDARRTLRRAGRVFARQGAGQRANLWCLWKLHWQWSLLPLAPCLLIPGILQPLLLLLAISILRVWVGRIILR